jgi:HSP20 family protein
MDMVEKTQMASFWPQMFEPFRSFGARIAEWMAPASEASSDENAYRIAIELPGVEEKDIHLNVEGGMVTVRGEKRTQREEKSDTWYFSERQFGSFARSFRLPADADETGVKAALKDGVLTVTVPRKAKATPEGRRVPISTS